MKQTTFKISFFIPSNILYPLRMKIIVHVSSFRKNFYQLGILVYFQKAAAIVVLGPDHVQLTKVNWRLKVNWKNFQEFFWKIFPIDFIVVNHVLWVNSIAKVISQLKTSKVNCKLQKSIVVYEIRTSHKLKETSHNLSIHDFT